MLYLSFGSFYHSGVNLSLPVISCVEPLPRGYLSLAEQGTLPLLENGKELFKVAVRGFSSTLSSNASIATLMRGYRANNEGSDSMMAAVKELAEVHIDLIVPHFPALVHVLIGLFDVKSELALQVCEKKNTVGSFLFCFLTVVVRLSRLC